MVSRTVLSYAMALIRLNLHTYKYIAQQQLIHILKETTKSLHNAAITTYVSDWFCKKPSMLACQFKTA